MYVYNNMYVYKIGEHERALITSVYADGNSSACIDSMGKLYTWGSMTSGRLMHPMPEPGNRVIIFLFI